MFWLLTLLHAHAADPTLTLRVDDLSSDNGQVLCTLYHQKATWLKDPGYLATTSAKPSNGSATCHFEGVPAGLYAVSFIHDVNGNNDMDFGWLGLPKEPYGFSNDAPMRLGPPSWRDAVIQHPSATPHVAHPK